MKPRSIIRLIIVIPDVQHNYSLRSIFDIEKSPFSGAGIEKLLAPIMSPANLSDVSDLADNGHAVALMAESAAEVPLEPGQYNLNFRVAISLFSR